MSEGELKGDTGPATDDAGLSTDDVTEEKEGTNEGGGDSGATSSWKESDDFICHQTTTKDNPSFYALLKGFKTLKEAQEDHSPLFPTDTTEDNPEGQDNANTSTDTTTHISEAGQGDKGPPSNHVVVSFIDPTTKPAAAPLMTQKAASMMSRNKTATSGTPAIENVFEKLAHIFQRDYGSTLRSVQYKNMRSGESDIIASIPVELILTRTGTASGNGEAANVAWGGMAASTPISDPSEWHNGPLCHVYIAACENMEHYRTKVRPSLQAFVSQLEASATPTTAANTLLGTPTSANQGAGNNPQFLIVYVPTGSGKDGTGNSEESTAPTGPVRRALASQLAKARERIINYNQENSKDLDTSQHSKDSLGSGDADAADDDPESMGTVSLNVLSQHERVLYQKLKTDFSNGLVCVFSKSSLDKSIDEMATDNAAVVVRTQEWNSFNRMLGAVIVGGFRERCKRYNDELRRLDSQRATAAQAAKTPNKPPNAPKTKQPSAVFNLCYFFLVKESLAFTYEQMQLPSEALLQYDEFRAFLPDELDEKEYKRALKLRRKSKTVNELPPLTELADSGDCIGFRRRIRSEFDLTPILDIFRRYLFAREISLLFKMEQPVEVISRCESFCKVMYAAMMRDFTGLSTEQKRQRESDASKWVIQFAWDVKSTCENYLQSAAEPSRESFDSHSIDTRGSDFGSQSLQSEQNIASRLGELLEMARLLLKKLGDTELAGGNPLRIYERNLPTDMFKPWQPWTSEHLANVDSGDAKENPRKFGREGGVVERQFLLDDDTFASAEKFERLYLDLAGAIVNLSRFGHRRRIAARLQGEIAEYLIRQGDFKEAASILKSIAKIYRSDQWDRCHFWRLFRLAYCQRTTATPTDYLKTLVTCFGPRTAAVAPQQALEVLQTDLEAVIKDAEIGEAKYGTIAFLETSMQILETSSDVSTMGTGIDLKKLVKRYCSVGETVRIKVTVTSFLPRSIILDSLKLFLVDFASFTSIIENRESVEEEDAVNILGLDTTAELVPGENTFTFDWEPSSAGQFILSTLEIVWNQGFFYYDSMELPAPLLGVDVLPSEPTHSMRLDPAYLVPGHDQDVRIIFDSGSDLVTAGKINLSCSNGITLIEPGQDPVEGQWKEECEITLGCCKPGTQTVLTIRVRCRIIESSSRVSLVSASETTNGLSARAFTTYLHAVAEGSDLTNTPKMKTVLEGSAPVLEKSALSVESIEALWLAPRERAMISINLMSNAPHQFFVEEMNLKIPPPLTTATNIDHNAELLKNPVSQGDHVALAFECIVQADKKMAEVDESILLLQLRDSEGKIFSLNLSLDLNDFYLQLLGSPAPKARGTAKASLKLAADSGEVGAPVKFSFTVDTQTEGEIVYSISADKSDWVLGGKVSGSMQRSGFMSLGFMGVCEVVGIPTVPGVLTRYPEIQIGTTSWKDGYIPLDVTFTPPPPFRSIARTSEVGIAFPTNKIAV